MAILKDILINVATTSVLGNTNIDVANICIDSRNVIDNCVFVALKGTIVDGHLYIAKAIAQGANTIVCENLPEIIEPSITYVRVADASIALGQMAAAFYQYPSKDLVVVGVTGTNGKTTVATLLYQLFTALGYKCGLISTVQNQIGSIAEKATHTTPDAVSIQALFAKMNNAGCSYVFMEVSSHAIHQNRIEGIEFDGAVFTNISHDHLDYHKTFDEYIKVKKRLFDSLAPKAFALSNIDDKRGAVMMQNTKAAQNTYSLRVPATFKGKVLENNLSGLVMDIDGHEAHLRMIGTFNAYNMLAVYGVAKLLDQDPMEILTHLSILNGAPGRFESLCSINDKVLGIVDYAHTPDALLNVLSTIQQLRNNEEQIITVVGCGGDRDTTKRPLMAIVAADKSNRVILTSDNPRSEDPEQILNEMEAELTFAQKRKVLRISDRKEAIKTACALANPGDIILVAGKGHENYQEIKGIRQHFDDKEELINAFTILNK
ncbi:MAG: UDP-N-acetylmuramoyl-L-alanyl-D-glutamate--2,6-diaminopimelate ligase [Chitinophagaceae bacterium]|nr:UDP-N-acetylmuramoyl-L-alanyl-D-glutamate--2,6-diaminopimelate ligase [Chitinophagaceae bacterium]